MEVREKFGALQSTGNFSNPLATNDQGHIDPITLWGFHGQDNIHLSTLVTKLLSWVARSSSTKKNWSTYGLIHSVKQNKLRAMKAKDLVFVHSNLCFLSHSNPKYKKGQSRM
jgi:hypothetical protein